MDGNKRGVAGWALGALIALIFCLPAPSPLYSQSAAAACPSGYALWANGQGRAETLVISSSTNSISGAVRSNADMRISGSNVRIAGAVEYVTTFVDSGEANSYSPPTQGSAQIAPVSYAIANYQPTGAVALAAQRAGRYTLVNGDFKVAEPQILDGLYYITGNATLSASDIRGTFTLVAEGTIDVSG